MGRLLDFETVSHSAAQDETTGMSHQAWLFITVEKVCIEGHLVSFCGKGVVIFSYCFIGHHKNKTDPVRL